MDSMIGMPMSTTTASISLPSMTIATATSVTSAAMASAIGKMSGEDMHGMDMGGDSCKISVLWNWYTVDACFVSHGWRITSDGMFAASCIGVVLMVIFLEFLRRASKEYDAHILKTYQRQLISNSSPNRSLDSSNDESDAKKKGIEAMMSLTHGSRSHNVFRPSLPQQMVRAGLHMVAFALAYFIMLLAMYYNGYIIMCIFIGAYLGFFIFSWELIELETDRSPAENPTNCCG